MKHIRIAGSGSYIGMQAKAYLERMSDRYQADELDVTQPFSEADFVGYDCVLLVAGIAHRKETPDNRFEYTQVNCDLAERIALCAKKAGVSQLIFFSSMSVYGCVQGRITKDTLPSPNTAYGQSKWDAEQRLSLLQDDSFSVGVLRPPMIYGKGCKGNYPKISSLSQLVPVFPKFRNERSMLYIETLCDFLRCLIDAGCGGLYFPQNRDYLSTCEMVREIGSCHGRTIHMIPGFGWMLRLLSKAIPTVAKVCGSLTYDQSMSTAFRSDDECPFAETIRRSECE